MAIFNFNDLSKQAKIGYNALYNVVFPYSQCKEEVTFTVPLCLNSDNKVSLTEKNFIFFESVLSELKLNGYYTLVGCSGRAVDEVKTDFFTVSITVSHKKCEPPKDLHLQQFDFSEVDTSKLMKRNGKEEKAKTEANKNAEAEKSAEAEKTAEALAEKSAEVETLKKEVAKKDEQLNKKAISEFNDEALFSIANCIEVLAKKHLPIPSDFDFTKFEDELFQVIVAHWDLKVLDK